MPVVRGQADWRCGAVLDPLFGCVFSEPGAWELIAELAEGGHPMTRTPLDHPPGAIAWTMLVDLGAVDALYIKVRVLPDQIVGLSFHPTYERGPGTPWKRRSHE